VKIYRSVRRHSLQIQAQQQISEQHINIPRTKKTVKNMYFIAGAFGLSYFPYVGCVAVIMAARELTQIIRILTRVAENIILLNSLINPIIYFWRIEELRNAARLQLRRIFNLN